MARRTGLVAVHVFRTGEINDGTGRGIVLHPPFNGTYRVTAYFDHDKPNYSIGDEGYIWIE